jgi:hypothetical protein
VGVGGAALAFFLVGAASLFEASFLFRDTWGALLFCKRTLAIGFLGFGALGAIAYLALWTGSVAGIYQVAKQRPNELALAFFALAAVQIGRIEGPSKSGIEGRVLEASDKESYYSKGMRWFRSRMYTRIVSSMPRDSRLDSLLMRGLPEAYKPEEVVEEFENWLGGRPAAEQPQLRTLLETTRKARKTGPRSKARTLFAEIVDKDVEHAAYLACRRASTVIDKQAIT